LASTKREKLILGCNAERNHQQQRIIVEKCPQIQLRPRIEALQKLELEQKALIRFICSALPLPRNSYKIQ
jgi:hypothetical protein